MGTNTLSAAVDAATIEATDVNQFRDAMNGDIVPRNSSGVQSNGTGSLGADAYRFANAFLNTKLDIGSTIRFLASGDSYISGGNFGFGTSTPTERVNVQVDTESNQTVLALENTSSSYTSGMEFRGAWNGTSFDSVSKITGGNPTGAAGELRFFTKNEAGSLFEAARLNYVGNFGVGTTSPASLLHLNNDANGENTVITLTAKNDAGTEKDVTLTWDPDTENLKINEDIFTSRTIGVGAVQSGNAHVEVQSTSSTLEGFAAHNNQSNYTGSLYQATVNKNSNPNFNFFEAISDADGTIDTEFLLRGDGNGLCDGAWSGGGADYAEYFESKTGKRIEVGTPVCLDGEKIRVALANETPMGVVRPKDASCIIGNNAWNHWKNKYIKNDFGEYQMEDVQCISWEEDVFQEKLVQKTVKKTVTEKELQRVGNKLIQKDVTVEKIIPVFEDVLIFDKNQKPVMDTKKDGSLYQKSKSEPVMEMKEVLTGKRNVFYKVSDLGDTVPPLDADRFKRSERILNSSYDASLKYIPTEKREEKVLVGLLGQIPIKTNTPLNSRWLKMKEINNNVHMYYVS